MSELPASATRQDVSGAQHVEDIQKALARRVLPALQKQLVSFASPARLVAAEHLYNNMLCRRCARHRPYRIRSVHFDLAPHVW